MENKKALESLGDLFFLLFFLMIISGILAVIILGIIETWGKWYVSMLTICAFLCLVFLYVIIKTIFEEIIYKKYEALYLPIGNNRYKEESIKYLIDKMEFEKLKLMYRRLDEKLFYLELDMMIGVGDKVENEKKLYLLKYIKGE